MTTTTRRAPARTATRTDRPSKARAAALTTDTPTISLPTLTPPVPSIEQLAAQAAPGIFRLLAAGDTTSAWRLLMTFQAEAEASYWQHVAVPGVIAYAGPRDHAAVAR